jgi:5-formyltetrahydrofolate cyclo-ligase
MTKDNAPARPYASPAWFAHEIDPCYVNPLAVDPQQASDVARWRRAERARLLPTQTRQTAARAIADHLDQLLADRFVTLNGLTISAWWPIKAELDLRFWLAGLAARGARAALPIVATRAAPLIFRLWTPETRMERGFWNIPVPAEGPTVVPDITLSPVVGWDAAGYRWATVAAISTARWRPWPRARLPSASGFAPRGSPPSFRNPMTSPCRSS